jgi:hypothetical protein
VEVSTVQDKTKKTDDDVQWCFRDVCVDRRHDGLREKVNLFSDGCAQRLFGRSDSMPNHGESIQMNHNHGDNGDALLLVDVSEESRNHLLSLGM